MREEKIGVRFSSLEVDEHVDAYLAEGGTITQVPIRSRTEIINDLTRSRRTSEENAKKRIQWNAIGKEDFK